MIDETGVRPELAMRLLEPSTDTYKLLFDEFLKSAGAESKLQPRLSGQGNLPNVELVMESLHAVSDRPQISPAACEKARRALYASSENPLASITPEAVVQHPELGNCYLMSTIASLANEDPQAIARMISVNADGTYTVRFPGGKPEGYTVEAPQYVPKGHEDNIWPYVLTRAFGQYRIESGLAQPGCDPELTTSNAETAFHDEMYLLTGRDYKSISSDAGNAELHEFLIEALNERNVPVTTGTGGRLDGLPESELKILRARGFEGVHAYSVTDYDPRSGLITLRNPHGGNVFVYMEDFKRYFCGFGTCK